jgi:hypothetical protein
MLRRPLLRALECGDDQTFEFTVAVVPIVAMIMLIAFATVVRAAQMPAWMAASECARQAIASVDEATGRAQAERAALDSLYANAIDPSTIRISITGDWTPNSIVSCQVSYGINVSNIAGFSELTGGRVPVVAEVALRVEPFKSRWR